MNSEQACENCRFWKWAGIDNEGFCRRNPPTHESDAWTRFPEALSDDWCGEWQQQEIPPLTVDQEATGMSNDKITIGRCKDCPTMNTHHIICIAFTVTRTWTKEKESFQISLPVTDDHKQAFWPQEPTEDSLKLRDLFVAELAHKITEAINLSPLDTGPARSLVT